MDFGEKSCELFRGFRGISSLFMWFDRNAAAILKGSVTLFYREISTLVVDNSKHVELDSVMCEFRFLFQEEPTGSCLDLPKWQEITISLLE